MKDSFDKIVANAKMAKETLQATEGELKNGESLGTFFHLRPTTNGVTLVSTLPYAPMRGVICKRDSLRDKLLAIDKMMPKLVDDKPNIAKNLEFLSTQGFKRRTGPGSRLEDVKAAFITGMNQAEEAYGGLNFITSDFTVPHPGDKKGGYRFDVIAFNEAAVYLIEIRTNRSEVAFLEMDRYVENLEKRQPEFKELIGALPLTAPGEVALTPADYDRVQGVVAMPEAENTTVNWQALADKHNVATWFYHTALAFRKLEPTERTEVL